MRIARCRVLGALLCLAGSSAGAAEPQAPPPREGPPAQTDPFAFDLLAEPPKPGPAGRPPAQLEREVRRRRALLRAHQAFGFVTLGLLTATVVLGQLNYVDQYVSGDFTLRYHGPHLGLAVASAASFATGGVLALAAPNPYPKPIRFDPALLHKLMMGLATAGMVTQLILGPVTARARVGRLDQPDHALSHLVTGYATWGFMVTGAVAWIWPGSAGP
jgi:hypothetical protein